MNLSKNFTLEEMIYTSHNIENKPNDTQIEALKLLCEKVLQPLRELYGKPIKINSGFRCLKLNTLVKGAKNSQHTKGEAADIDTANDNKVLYKIIREKLTFDQLIIENNYSWLHVSYRNGNNRGEVLEFKNGKYTKLA